MPEGVHPAPLDEVVRRFGNGTLQRRTATANLLRIHQLATATGALARFVVFGSYVTANPWPNDVDVVLVMRDDFVLEASPDESQVLFDHARATRELRASVFWVRPGMLLGETLDSFIDFWQTRRDGGRRGIVEVRG
jgi:hypothetical protein